MTDKEQAFAEAVRAAVARNAAAKSKRRRKAKPVHWLVGRKVVEVRPMTPAEMQAEGWDGFRGRPAAIVFDDGTIVYPSQDDEGNGSGALFGKTQGKMVRV